MTGTGRFSDMAIAGAVGVAVGAGAVGLWVWRRGRAEARGSREYYEKEASARQYLEFHYTPSRDSFAQKLGSISEAHDFPQRLGRLCIAHSGTRGRALDLGCASGASTFVMSEVFNEVVGVDLSPLLIRDARRMQNERKIAFRAAEQGLRGVERTAELPQGSRPERCTFHVGDALRLDASLGTFDCILAANLLCRVPDPERLLASICRAIRVGGTVILVSPYSWWEEASAPATWIGGQEGGAPSEVLVKKRMVELGFDLLHEGTEPFVLRDHVRRYQLGFSHCTVWRATARVSTQ